MKTDNYGRTVWPEWLIEAVPGAVEARDAWEAASAPLPALTAEHKDAIRAALPLGSWSSGVYGPAENVSMADFDAAQLRKKSAQRAQEAAGRRAGRARERFEELMRTARPDEVRALAGARAVAAQAEAVQALATLRAALETRQEAHEVAGRPGMSWEAHSSAPADPRAAQAQAFHTIGVMVEGFDLDAAQATADGETVPSLATFAARMAAADEAAKAATGSKREGAAPRMAGF